MNDDIFSFEVTTGGRGIAFLRNGYSHCDALLVNGTPKMITIGAINSRDTITTGSITVPAETFLEMAKKVLDHFSELEESNENSHPI